VETTLTFKDTIDRVKARLTELRKHRGTPGTSASDEPSTVIWPGDLNASDEVPGSWGTDPVEGA
jgi:hypothetical protein